MKYLFLPIWLFVAIPSAFAQSLLEASVYRDIDVNATAEVAKNSKGYLVGWYLYNSGSAVRYVKIYDKATAATVGTDTPKLTIPIPAGGGANVSFPGAVLFSNGISFAAVTGVADSNTTAPGANEVVANLLYK